MNKWSRFLSVILFLCMTGFLKPSHAMDLNALDQTVSITVREQPVQQFLETLFSQVNVPVVVSEKIEGLMNGKFDGSARSVFNDIANAFNITLYFDGVVAYVYSANEITRTLMPVSGNTADRVQKIANRMNLGDRNNKVDSSGGGGLMVTGTRRFMEQIEELSFSVQANAKSSKKAPLAYRVFYLSNAWAADTSFNIGGQSVTVNGVATLLHDLVADGQLPGSVGGKAPVRSKNTVDGLRGQGLQSVRDEAAAEVDTQFAEQQFSQQGTGARIVADSRLNAVIIRDTADRMPAYQELISDLDRPSQMVEIEATIIDINTDKTRELGIGWQYRRSDGDGAASLLGGAGDQAGLISPGALIQGPGAILSMALGGREQFLTRIKALEEKGAARVVSKPHVITLSDVEAVLGATTEFFVRVAGDEEVDLFNVPVGTTLRVTPHVFQETGQSRIKLLVNIEDGTASSREVDRIPVVERANINTQAVVNEGDSLLIGGLVRDSYRQVATGVPLLSNIPFLGRLFKSTSNQSSRVERLFMITPRTAQGQGFDRTHNGRKALPLLQGDPADIEAQVTDRMAPQSQPFGKRVNDLPFEPLLSSSGAAPLNMPVVPDPSDPSNRVPVADDQSLEQWVAITGSEVISQEAHNNVGSKVATSEWANVPVTEKLPDPILMRKPVVDQDGWMVIE